MAGKIVGIKLGKVTKQNYDKIQKDNVEEGEEDRMDDMTKQQILNNNVRFVQKSACLNATVTYQMGSDFGHACPQLLNSFVGNPFFSLVFSIQIWNVNFVSRHYTNNHQKTMNFKRKLRNFPLFFHLRQRSKYFPIFPRHAWTSDGRQRPLAASFRINETSLFFRVGRRRQDNVGHCGARVALVPDIDDCRRFAAFLHLLEAHSQPGRMIVGAQQK
uniref:Uncharacterized protein n=1 Tax=Romanomermis culicivorax TaxID=13658 RepID=A0A915KUW8_ROMCU